MIRVVFVSRDKDQFVELEQMLTRHNVDVERSGSGKELLSLLSDTPKGEWIDLVIMEEALPDTDAVSLVKSFIPQSPMTNTVVAGTMEKKEFHDIYEGYGVLMQVSPTPTADDAQDLEERLQKIGALNG